MAFGGPPKKSWETPGTTVWSTVPMAPGVAMVPEGGNSLEIPYTFYHGFVDFGGAFVYIGEGVHLHMDQLYHYIQHTSQIAQF